MYRKFSSANSTFVFIIVGDELPVLLRPVTGVIGRHYDAMAEWCREVYGEQMVTNAPNGNWLVDLDCRWDYGVGSGFSFRNHQDAMMAKLANEGFRLEQ